MISSGGDDFHEKYTLSDKLGEGAYSIVKKAIDKKDGSFAAVKCIDKKKLSANDIQELKHEVKILSENDHPNLLKLHGFYEDAKYYYLVTEFVAGGELFERIVEKEFYNEKDAQQVMLTLGSAIKYLHDKGIVHRDLKPENILLTTKDDSATIKIADFGFAKKIGAKGLTTSLGTPGYVAPEILKGAAYDASVDMWAIGVILYILLCGYPPFYDESQPKLFEKIKAGAYQFDEPYWTPVSASAKDLIQNLLVVDPKKRYTIHDLLKHPWIVDESSSKDLTPAIGELRQYLNRRKLRAGIHAVHMLNKMKLTAMTKGGSLDIDSNESTGSLKTEGSDAESAKSSIAASDVASPKTVTPAKTATTAATTPAAKPAAAATGAKKT